MTQMRKTGYGGRMDGHGWDVRSMYMQVCSDKIDRWMDMWMSDCMYMQVCFDKIGDPLDPFRYMAGLELKYLAAL